MTETSDTHYRQTDGLEVHEAEDGLILFDAGTDKVHHLNPTAGVMFTLCESPKSAGRLFEEMAALFDLKNPDDSALAETLNKLLEEGVVAPTTGD